jgi:hypothetical protein
MQKTADTSDQGLRLNQTANEPAWHQIAGADVLKSRDRFTTLELQNDQYPGTIATPGVSEGYPNGTNFYLRRYLIKYSSL